LTAPEQRALDRLRATAAKLADVEETTTFGNPTFKVRGRSIAVLDRYNGKCCLWLRIGIADRASWLEAPGWFASPYDPRNVALCCELDQFDWRRLGPLLAASYWLAEPTPRRSQSKAAKRLR
jgi:hypothetical protein